MSSLSMPEQSRRESMLEELRALVDRQSRGFAPGVSATPINDLFVVRQCCDNSVDHCMERPLVSIILQGHKHMSCGFRETARDFSLTAGDSILVAVDMPTTSSFPNNLPDKPFLAVFLYLNKDSLLDLSLKMSAEAEEAEGAFADPDQGRCSVESLDGISSIEDEETDGIAVASVDEDFLSCMLRLARLWEKPEQIAVRAPIIAHELHYVLLCSSYGHILRRIYRRGSQNSSVVQAIALLRRNLAIPLRVDELARQVNMSVSSLHRHFKQLTGYSPLQYRKQLRLLEARRLMFSENEQAARAALTVGYESITQFNREYKRLFGESPHRDIRRLQTA